MIEAYEGFIYLVKMLEDSNVNPIWVIIVLGAVALKALCPYDLKGKIETEEKDGKKVSKIFKL